MAYPSLFLALKTKNPKALRSPVKRSGKTPTWLTGMSTVTLPLSGCPAGSQEPIHHPSFGMYWQTRKIYSAKSQGSTWKVSTILMVARERDLRTLNVPTWWTITQLTVLTMDFFYTTPVEAAAMDPQQRMLLEVAYEAVESAGIPLNAFVGTDTSVFADEGLLLSDYVGLWGQKADMVQYFRHGGYWLPYRPGPRSGFHP